MNNTVENLFSEDYLDAFAEGLSSYLVLNRNKNLGNLLNSERRLYYIQILYRLLCFRREYDLEPLNEEIYAAVKEAQESFDANEYQVEHFNHDIHQLTEWNIIAQRIEKERLRGYKDVSRNKFRYRISDDTIAFIHWLEERLQEDLEERAEDTRNLLMDVSNRLNEVRRGIGSYRLNAKDKEKQESQAREIIYQIEKLNELTVDVNLRLGDLNARLLGFLLSNYMIDEAKNIIQELDFYIKSYLRQINQLRKDIIPDIEKLLAFKNLEKLYHCRDVLEEERQKMPHLLKRKNRIQSPRKILIGLRAFYEAQGQLGRTLPSHQ